jgi:hypothetical protein
METMVANDAIDEHAGEAFGYGKVGSLREERRGMD